MAEIQESHISLEQARQLVSYLETGNIGDANALVESVTAGLQQDIFDEVGKLTRQLHNSITDFSLDARFSNLVNNSLPDAKERLDYVVSMTADAANQTMDVVEECLPMFEQQKTSIEEILPSWQRLRNCTIKIDEFRQLRGNLDDYFSRALEESVHLQGKLTDILMAQGYQDLTGQVLHKIMELVRDVEDNLINLLQVFGQANAESNTDKQESSIAAEGPVVAAAQREDVVAGQDEVDDLLSSLGF